MTTSERLPRPVEVGRSQGCRKGSILADWLSSTDHKIIGHRYLITSSGFFHGAATGAPLLLLATWAAAGLVLVTLPTTGRAART